MPRWTAAGETSVDMVRGDELAVGSRVINGGRLVPGRQSTDINQMINDGHLVPDCQSTDVNFTALRDLTKCVEGYALAI